MPPVILPTRRPNETPAMLTDNLLIALRIALVSLLAYQLGASFTALFHASSASVGGLWSAVSGVVVLQATRRDTWTSAGLRVLGTAIGALISAVYLSLLPFSTPGMAASVFATVLLCQLARIPDHARLASITVMVIMVIAHLSPGLNPVHSALLRFAEAFIGTAVAVLAVLAWPQNGRPASAAAH